MKRNTLSVTFYCRDSKVDRNGLAKIEMGINCNGTRLFINLPMKVKPADFNRKRQPAYITSYTDTVRVTVNEIIGDMLSHGIPLTAEALRNYFRTGGIKPYTVSDMVKEFLSLKSKDESAGVITFGQYKKYEYTANLLYDYVDKDDEVSVFTPALIKNIYADLRIKYKDGTSSGYMTRIKAMMRHCLDNGKLEINPFQGVRITKAKPDIEMISDEDFNKILTFHSNINRLMKVRDIFLFACGTGLGYADCARLTPEDFQVIDGTECIVKKRVKTGVDYVAVLLPCAKHVAEKYNYNLKDMMMSGVKTNAYLKEIQDICGLTSVNNLHFYLGRHYYLNHLLNEKGIRAEVVSKMAGHSNYRTLMKYYAKVDASTVIKETKNKVG